MIKRRNDRGQAIVVLALSMVAIMSFMGLAVDLGYLRYMKREMQKLADASAIAAAVELNQCGSTTNCTAMQKAAQGALTENGYTGSTLTTQTSTCTSTSALAIVINNPPLCLGSTAKDPHYNNNHYIEVVVSNEVPVAFTQIFGVKTVPVIARAEAALGGGSNCIYALDPTDSDSLQVDAFASINSPCGIVTESSSSSAFSCGWFASVKVTNSNKNAVVGNDSDFLCTTSPNPTTGISVPTPADPLAYLTAPTVGACGSGPAGGPYTGYNGSGSGLSLTGAIVVTLNPGVYCGGITIGNGATVTMNAGTYIMTSPTLKTGTAYGFTVDEGSSVTGTGVTIYNTTSGATYNEGPIQFNYTSFGGGASGVDLTAPTSGSLEGILFWQDKANTTASQIIGTSSWNTVLEGAYYFPKAKITFALDGLENYTILDAYQIHMEFFTFSDGTQLGSSQLYNNYGSLADGSPVHGVGGVVVE